MSRSIQAVEICCDGLRSCAVFSAGSPARDVIEAAKCRGWLVTSELDLCPSCWKLPEFRELNHATFKDSVNLLDELMAVSDAD